MKDLSRLGRDLRRVLIVDNSPASYVFHPDNAVSASWDGAETKDRSQSVWAALVPCSQAGQCPWPGALLFLSLPSPH